MREQKKRSVASRLTVVFGLGLLGVLLISGIILYLFEIHQKTDETIETMKYTCTLLRNELEKDGANFKAYQEYILGEGRDKVVVDPEFTEQDCDMAYLEFEQAFADTYPGKIYGKDIQFAELSDELKELFATWYCEKLYSRVDYYEELTESPYIYYVVPDGMDGNMWYVVDIERVEDENFSDGRMRVWDYYKEDPAEMPVLYTIWQEKQNIDAVDKFSNEYGNTYSYYELVTVDDEYLGIVCIDMNSNIFWKYTVKEARVLLFLMLCSMLVLTGLLMGHIRVVYVRRLTFLNACVERYTRDRDISVATDIRAMLHSGDEIDALGWRIIAMLNQIHCHLTDIMMITESLHASKEEVDNLRQMALQDGLTRLYNKTAYVEAENKLNEQIKKGTAHFALIMVDLNYLKRLNDNYGHEKGDLVLQRIAGYLLESFDAEHVYRVGGDEFVVIVDNYVDKSDIDRRLQTFCDAMQTANDKVKAKGSYEFWEITSAAFGYSECTSEDKECSAVLKRADAEMYACKKLMKAERLN